MVASKKLHCVICNKKCSGNVLRYQDQYYHKQCFELEQSQGTSRQQSYIDTEGVTPGNRQAYHATDHSHSSQSPILSSNYNNNTSDVNQHPELMNHSSSQPTAASHQHQQQSRSIQSRRLELSRDPSNGDMTADNQMRSQTIDSRFRPTPNSAGNARSATLPHSVSSPNGFLTGNVSHQFTSKCGSVTIMIHYFNAHHSTNLFIL